MDSPCYVALTHILQTKNYNYSWHLAFPLTQCLSLGSLLIFLYLSIVSFMFSFIPTVCEHRYVPSTIELNRNTAHESFLLKKKKLFLPIPLDVCFHCVLAIFSSRFVFLCLSACFRKWLSLFMCPNLMSVPLSNYFTWFRTQTVLAKIMWSA